MLYLLDTANIENIRHCKEYYPLSGVTTNPTIIAKEGKDFWELLTEIRSIIGEERMLHVQITQKTADGIVKEAKRLRERLSGKLYIKIPIGEEGLKATKQLKKNGYRCYYDSNLHTCTGTSCGSSRGKLCSALCKPS